MYPYGQKGRTMGMLVTISGVVLLLAGLFVWRYETATGEAWGIVKLIHDRVAVARLRRFASAKSGTTGD